MKEYIKRYALIKGKLLYRIIEIVDELKPNVRVLFAASKANLDLRLERKRDRI